MSIFTSQFPSLSNSWNLTSLPNEVPSSLQITSGDTIQQSIQYMQLILQNFCNEISKNTKDNHNNIELILNNMDKAIAENKETIQLVKNTASKPPLALIQKESIHCSPVNIMASLFLAIFIISLFATVMTILGLTGVLSNVSIFFGSVNLVWAASSCAAVSIISLIAFVCLSVYGFLHKEISTTITEKKIETATPTLSNTNTIYP
ncbi:hypothetical protein CLAVI_000868 [Candidatus Clavichlamydia salmonicola]|uniref:hypothetical protein n=1 Tax=Candidatus Clavichlamydia salmonicola TaxID=469812 RepID=UPI001891BA88|nr:hypothetical protein [Candidatus Clavichlamydia salmonicola]MBF5051227.1 hypothetical protein [Candidatus Clavichlamydia salmonicola]